MKINIIGFRKVDYVNKNGKQIVGASVFAIGDSSREDTKGQVWVGKVSNFSYSPIFISSNVSGFDRLSLGAWEMDFDLNGNVSRLEKIKID